MTKHLIEVDDHKLAAVRELLGATTVEATVDEAFDEVLALAERRRALLADRGVDESKLGDGMDDVTQRQARVEFLESMRAAEDDLGDAEVMRGAWR